MSERRDEKWLDRQLQRAVDGTSPVFDARAWKQKYSNEYQHLLARGTPGPAVLRVILGSWIGKLAVAAAIAVAVALFVLGRGGHGLDKPTISHGPVAYSPASRMMSMMSLRTTYQRGGFDAVDRQLQDTLDEFRPRSSSVPTSELF